MTNLVTTKPRGPYSYETPITVSGGFVADGTNMDTCGKPFTDTASIPYYQQNLVTDPNSNVSTNFRNVPDVSMVGNKMEDDYHGVASSGYGTSWSSPLWAGFMALVNEQSANNYLGPVGFANPVLYAIGKTMGSANDVYATCFNDVQSPTQLNPPQPSEYLFPLGVDYTTCTGCENCTDAPTFQVAFLAAKGYDVATGLGSPTFELINQLASSTPSPVLDVSAGLANTCAVRTDNTVSCWGSNVWGELGNGTTNADVGSNVPVPVSNLSTATAVSVGDGHVCALLNTGKDGGPVQCWGYNNHGQLGNGTTADSSIPVAVTGITTAMAVSAGSQYSCALLKDGSVQCWGDNSVGQLGDGLTLESHSPVTVFGLTTAAAVSAGGGSACALVDVGVNGGTVQCWGVNDAGQLGNGVAGGTFTLR